MVATRGRLENLGRLERLARQDPQERLENPERLVPRGPPVRQEHLEQMEQTGRKLDVDLRIYFRHVNISYFCDPGEEEHKPARSVAIPQTTRPPALT